MPDKDDYEDILDGTVEEVKNAVKDLENPDFSRLLDLEREGDDRKTLKQFFQDRMEEQDTSEDTAQEEAEEAKAAAVPKPGAEGLSGKKLGVAGLIAGLLAGFAAASLMGAGGGVDRVAPSSVQQNVKKLVTSGGFNGTVDVSRPEVRNSMYFVNVTITRQTVNGSQTSSQGVFVTLDGSLLVPVRRNPLTGQLISPVPIQQRLQAMQQRTGNRSR